jgi:hypothetical protein
VATGINKLSFSVGVENNSIIADINTAIMFTMKSAGDKENIMIDEVIKKADDPSNDLLNKYVLPYFIPIIAAAESDKLITKREIIATFSLNKNIVAAEPIKTQDAPENL